MPVTDPTHPSPIARNLLRWGVLALLLLPLRAWAGDDYERWYVLELGGKRAGYMHAAQVTQDGRMTSSSKLVMAFGRGATAIKLEMEGTFVETADGKPVSMVSNQVLGATPLLTSYEFTDKGVRIETRQGEEVTKAEAPLPEGIWLTPAAATDYVRQRLAAEAQEIVVRTIEPMTGVTPATITRKGIRKTTTTVLGKTIPVFECVSITSTNPTIESTEVIDDQGIPVRTTASMGPGLTVTIRASTRAAALAKAGEAPEIMVRTFVKPDRAIPRPRELTSATYLLTIASGEMPELPSTGSQSVEAAGERSVRVRVEAGRRAAAAAADAEDPSFTASTPMLNYKDGAVERLIGEALAGVGEEPLVRTEALRRFVHEHVSIKDLGVGFATASEVARTRQGDCTEHATLLAAMLRGAGIPSRVVSGLIYADQFAGEREIFGYHMWAQALLTVDGVRTWVDLDPTLPAQAFDATHVALTVSSLPDADATRSLSALVPLLGRVQIRVEKLQEDR